VGPTAAKAVPGALRPYPHVGEPGMQNSPTGAALTENASESAPRVWRGQAKYRESGTRDSRWAWGQAQAATLHWLSCEGRLLTDLAGAVTPYEASHGVYMNPALACECASQAALLHLRRMALGVEWNVNLVGKRQRSWRCDCPGRPRLHNRSQRQPLRPAPTGCHGSGPLADQRVENKQALNALRRRPLHPPASVWLRADRTGCFRIRGAGLRQLAQSMLLAAHLWPGSP